jgi:hypothetical protein
VRGTADPRAWEVLTNGTDEDRRGFPAEREAAQAAMAEDDEFNFNVPQSSRGRAA